MQYGCVVPARFLDRPNRFVAHVLLGQETVTCHVKNTGRCRELLVPGATVYLERGTNPNRRTAWDLIAADKGGKLINMDAQAPNRVFAQWARERWADVRPEVRYGRSRLDFCLDGHHLVEVKGVTLEQDGRCRFPDAPTERGTRHLHELIRAVEEGYQATAFFVIQMENAMDFAPNDDTDPAFGQGGGGDRRLFLPRDPRQHRNGPPGPGAAVRRGRCRKTRRSSSCQNIFNKMQGRK